ncbi:YCF48-related protein [Flavobacterium wongokense]|uniref:YCF48-related protein n=1 Tax=Flavobacterium wongokense TaxID=2910674 RepID=UPI001F41CA9A|nr:YCF48-related protein [Flavobacterium sp. WG47]MCF6133132.1 YCF48-related protein [Flavobacterium sp. WG47]
MKKTTSMMLLACFLFANNLFAQFLIKDTFYETCGVSNQGTVSGYEAQAGPYSLWFPETNTVQQIGGAAPGFGIGGSAEFSSNGNLLSGTNNIVTPLSMEWQRNVLASNQYIYRSIAFPDNQDRVGFAAGQQYTSNGNGIVLRTINGGETWTPVWTDNSHRGIESMSFVNFSTGYVCGWNQYCAKTINSGMSWTALTPGGSDSVYIYTSIDFMDESNGIVGAQLDDSPALYITNDGGDTWTTATGLEGIPYKITHIGGVYFLITNGGTIQKSTDLGLSWTTIYNNPANLLVGINFYDEMTAIVTCETYILKTIDGGETWTQSSISPMTEGMIWRDVAWTTANNLILVGTPDLIFESNDGGTTWNWANETLFNAEPALYDIAVTGTDIHVCGSQGNFYKKSLIPNSTRTEMARYDITNNQWTNLGSLGINVDGNVSGGFDISGDGNTLVGLSWANPAVGNGTTLFGHSVAWSAAEGFMDLGSLYDSTNRSTRANAVSHDGNVVVGWQDLNGPWKSAVWRKNPAGGYFPNEFLLINPNGSATDEYNQLGECSAVSSDGNWIGGIGDYANNNEPWIWSQSTGVINLGSLTGGNGTGYVASINHDGTMVIGWFDIGPFDPTVPFIWTPTGGLQEFNAYVENALATDLGNKLIFIPNSMSENGRYIVGWGVDFDASEWGELFTFRVQLPDSLGTSNPGMAHVSVFPNPVRDILNLTAMDSIISVSVYTISGQIVFSEKSETPIQKIDLSTLSSGVYFVKAATKNGSKTIKIIKE